MKLEASAETAVYIPQAIVDYMGNPFIEALPPILSAEEAIDAMTVTPGYSDAERGLDAHYRFHCIQRLFRYFQPLDTHIEIEQRISRAIRQGYVNRNPLHAPYVQQLRQCGDAVSARSMGSVNFSAVRSTAVGFTIIGMSGVGKTTAIERVLSLYPQRIRHLSYGGHPFYLEQLTWLKLDCPFDGSIKGLCINFFAEVDSLLDSTYAKKFLASKTTVDAIIPRMAQVAWNHGLGLLVIDEIQHLSQAKSGGSEKMLNFFVTLVNTLGIPVVLIGTTKAMSILQSEFRQARRGSGQGDLLWERMQEDTSWKIMIRSMWKYQWTKTSCPLTSELEKTLYSESQGIIDIAIKLYALSQIKAIADRTETILPATIHAVAVEKLSLVKPMLDALRSGDKKKLLLYEDIRPISVEDYIAAHAAHVPAPAYTAPTFSLEEQAVLKLLEMDISVQTARRYVKRVLAGNKDAKSLGVVVRKAFKLALDLEESQKFAPPSDSPGDDLREKVGYDKLKQSGVIAEKDEW